jgi:glycerol-3-phosphate acyltransferase PlsY
MTEQLIYFACIVGCYLAGAIPFGWLFVRVRRGIDLRTVGSGNIGATNAARVLGGAWFFPIFTLDFIKGFAPVFWLAPWIAKHYPCPN